MAGWLAVASPKEGLGWRCCDCHCDCGCGCGRSYACGSGGGSVCLWLGLRLWVSCGGAAFVRLTRKVKKSLHHHHRWVVICWAGFFLPDFWPEMGPEVI